MNREPRFGTGMSTAKTIFNAIPVGTILIVMVSTIVFLINLFVDITTFLAIQSGGVIHGLPWKILSFFTFQLAHNSFYHQIVATLLFPFAASNFENRVGTFQFLYIFFFSGMVMAGLYVFVFWLISFVLPSWGTANVCGLDIPFFFLITTEALSDQGLFEVAKQAGLHLPNILFPLPWVVAFFILLSQSTSVFGHMFAIFIGIIHSAGILDPFLLSSQALNALDTTPYLSFLSNHKTFVMKPGEVQLSIPGAFDPTTHTGSLRDARGERPSFIGALKNSFNSSKYAPIQNYETLESQANPLLWDESDEENQQNVVKPLNGP